MSRPSSLSWLPPSSTPGSVSSFTWLGTQALVDYMETLLELQLWNINADGNMVSEKSALRSNRRMPPDTSIAGAADAEHWVDSEDYSSPSQPHGRFSCAQLVGKSASIELVNLINEPMHRTHSASPGSGLGRPPDNQKMKVTPRLKEPTHR